MVDTVIHSDALRFANVTIAMIAATIMIASTTSRWHQMPNRYKRISVWFIIILLIIAYGSGEAYAQDAPLSGIRALLMLLALCGLVLSLLYRFHEPYEWGEDVQGPRK